ncbi:MAG: NTP transferase domain-containing protein [Clostridia bacterium]|nr:NTP transferase domain-containing protein [Clostridia bacterium]
MSKEKLAALILAAGYSSRMGEFKPLLPLNGEPVIARTVSCFRAAGITDVRVVAGYRANDLLPLLNRLGVKTIINEKFDCGMFSSVLTGLQTFDSELEGFFLMPGDIPRVKSQTIETLIAKYKQSDYRVFYPTYQGRRGHPPLITRPCFSRISAQDYSGNLRLVLQEFENESCDVECTDEGVLMDMDTPEDYQKIIGAALKNKIPTVSDCQRLFSRYQVPEGIMRHGRAVADGAQKIARHLNERRGFMLDIELITAAGLLHDIAKGQPNHAQKGAAILVEEGFPAVAQVVEAHMDLSIDYGKDHPIDEKAIIYLVDKIIHQEDIGSIEGRFSKAFEKYADNEEILQNIKKRQEQALFLKERIEDLLDIENLYSFLAKK